jgi:CSLREA domain-containing protein
VVASPGTGNTVVTLDTTAHTLRVQATFSGLTSNTTASHIHCCVTVAGGNAGVATTTPTFAGFPLGVTSGTLDTTLAMTQASAWNPAFVTANGGTNAGAEAALTAGLAAGTAYFNIHTTNNGGGEIRGFLVIQPIVVNSTADVAANDGQCTLREAITAANTNTASGAMAGECAAGQALPTVDTITFDIPARVCTRSLRNITARHHGKRHHRRRQRRRGFKPRAI